MNDEAHFDKRSEVTDDVKEAATYVAREKGRPDFRVESKTGLVFFFFFEMCHFQIFFR